MSAQPIGIVANPASGKDVRRLVARASVFDNQEKCAIIRRAIVGAIAGGTREFVYMPDTHGITQSALDEFAGSIDFQAVESPATGSVLDTVRSARALKEAGCAVVITLGGDGTNRAFTQGWRDAVLLPVSTGTNNVFPDMVEATVAGAAAGLYASGAVSAEEVLRQSKAITVSVDGEKDDIALIDAVLSAERFVGSRALLSSHLLRMILLTRADPAAVGMTSIGGLLAPLKDKEDAGLLIEIGEEGQRIRAPIAPGLYQDITVKSARRIEFGEPVTIHGLGVLAFDGERERLLKQEQQATFTIKRDGPWVIDIKKTLKLAAKTGQFCITGE
ncbi:MAG: NAD(+)/NADH kinase [Pseudomonadota bacterium]